MPVSAPFPTPSSLSRPDVRARPPAPAQTVDVTLAAGGARADPQQLQLPALLAAIEGAAGRRAEEAGRLRGTEAELRRQLREMVEAVAAARAAGPPAALAPSCSS
eukprot:tig00000113_g5617.t1